MSPCLKKFRRSYPYITLLHKGIKQNKDKLAILKSFPDFVLSDLIEVLFNILQGNCHISKKQLHQIQKQRKSVTQFYKSIQRTKSHKGRKKVLYKQKGGFIGALLPIVASIASGLASSAL